MRVGGTRIAPTYDVAEHILLSGLSIAGRLSAPLLYLVSEEVVLTGVLDRAFVHVSCIGNRDASGCGERCSGLRGPLVRDGFHRPGPGVML